MTLKELQRSKPIKVSTSDFENWEFFDISDDTWDKINKIEGLKILTFSYENEGPRYYEKLYINECMHSWVVAFDKVIFINVLITPQVKALSKWTSLDWVNNKKYPTDSLRLYFIARIANSIYLDTDVFLAPDFTLRTDLDCFVYRYCSGTMLYNRERNNTTLLDWFDFYEKTADILAADPNNNPDINDYAWFRNDYGDMSMYNRFSKVAKYYPTSLDLDSSIGHFSNIFPYQQQKLGFSIVLERYTGDKTNNFNSYFPYNSKWGFIYYCLDKRLQPEIVGTEEEATNKVKVYFV